MTSKRRKEIRRKRKARRRTQRGNKAFAWFLRMNIWQKALLIMSVLLLTLFVVVGMYVANKFSKINQVEIPEGDIIINELDESVGQGYTNFVVFGSDARGGKITQNANTDTIIIVSLNNETREIKLVSVYRDTLLDLSNGSIKKCNSAYATGGATRAINMLNMNLDLNITKFVTVDFSAVVDLVDMVGGIEVDVTTTEYKEINKYIGETARVAGKKANLLTHGGLQKLDGVQATTYARIRKNVGNDYARTERQRLVIQKILEKAKKSDLATINNMINEFFPRVATNFTLTEVLSYAKDFMKYEITETSGFPFNKGSGKIPSKGDSVYPITLKSNVSQLHEFLFGTKDYQPTSKVVSISSEIAAIVGNRKADPATPSTGTGTGSGTEEGTGTGTEEGTGEGTEPGTGEGTEPGTGEGTEPGTGEGTEPGTGEGTEPGTGEGTQPGTGEGTQPGTGEGTQPGTGEGNQPGTEETPAPGNEPTQGTGETN